MKGLKERKEERKKERGNVEQTGEFAVTQLGPASRNEAEKPSACRITPRKRKDSPALPRGPFSRTGAAATASIIVSEAREPTYWI